MLVTSHLQSWAGLFWPSCGIQASALESRAFGRAPQSASHALNTRCAATDADDAGFSGIQLNGRL